MLHIVQGGDGAGAVSQAGMAGNIGGPLSVNPDFRGLVFKPLQVLGAGAGGHKAVPRGCSGCQYNRVEEGERMGGSGYKGSVLQFLSIIAAERGYVPA